MATLTNQIEALIAYANETTGKSDTHLGDAVKSLADGYGQGGGGGIKVLNKQITLSSTATKITIDDVPEDVISITISADYEGNCSYGFAYTNDIEQTATIYSIGGGSKGKYFPTLVSTEEEVSYNKYYIGDGKLAVGSATSGRPWCAGTYTISIYYQDTSGGEHDMVQGTTSLSQEGKTITIEHNLGYMPSFARLYLTEDGTYTNSYTIQVELSLGLKNLFIYRRGAGSINWGSCEDRVTETSISFNTYSSNYFPIGEYKYEIY